jgi:hypothetical protein
MLTDWQAADKIVAARVTMRAVVAGSLGFGVDFDYYFEDSCASVLMITFSVPYHQLC